MWIGEIVSRKWKDVVIRPDGHARIKIAALDTKGKYKRFAFVTKQTVDWLKQFRPFWSTATRRSASTTIL